MPLLLADGGCGCLIFVLLVSLLSQALLPSLGAVVLVLAAACLLATLFGGSSGGK
ncbi:MAG TPA: hypothetical protein VGE52_06775 [Pirellulales bacterium]